MNKNTKVILFFLYVIFSLTSVNIFIFNQGWYSLIEFDSKFSLAMSWTVFFLPSLMIPFLMRFLQKRNSILQILKFHELLKVAVLIAFELLSKTSLHSKELVIITSFLLGSVFSVFYPVIYALLKRLSEDVSSKIIYYIEIGVQLSTVLGLFISALLFEAIGFLHLILLAQIIAMLAYLISFGLKKYDIKVKVEDIGSSKGISKYPFGLIHLLPQTCIYLLTIPFILELNRLGEGPVTFSISEITFSVVSLIIASLVGKFEALRNFNYALAFYASLTVLTLVVASLLEMNLNVFFLIVAVLSVFLTISKVKAREDVIVSIPKEKLTAYNFYYQAFSNFILIITASAMTFMSERLPSSYQFLALAIVMAIFSIIAVYSRERVQVDIG